MLQVWVTPEVEARIRVAAAIQGVSKGVIVTELALAYLPPVPVPEERTA